MKQSIYNIYFFFLFFCSCSLYAQVDFDEKYEVVLESNSLDNNIESIFKKAKEGNVLSFMELGYFINANTMKGNYQLNDSVINVIIKTGIRGDSYKWIVKDVDRKSQNYVMKNKEFIIYEGYLFRYIAHYLKVNPKANIVDKNFVKRNFLKWYNKSIRENGDAALLYGTRLHMGSHWATVALFLMHYDDCELDIYKNFLSEFDNQLRNNLLTIRIHNKDCYIWNSSYSEKFTSILTKRINEHSLQDVSHGNHIIQYVIDSYYYNRKEWNKDDLVKFSNTLKYIIWSDLSNPLDYVYFSDYKLLKSGWKQSDGWMKLMVVLDDEELYNIYTEYYKKKYIKIDKFYPNLQFYANMIKFKENRL